MSRISRRFDSSRSWFWQGAVSDPASRRLPRPVMLDDERRDEVRRDLAAESSSARFFAPFAATSPVYRPVKRAPQVLRATFSPVSVPTKARPGRLVYPVAALQMQRPGRVGFCVRRKQRREFLFAAGVAGSRGVGRGRSWRRTAESSYRC